MKATTPQPRVARINVARLYNLGSYEHVRYELTVDVPEGKSASAALLGVERILVALSPKSPTKSRTELAHEARRVDLMREHLAKGVEEFYRHYGRSFVGTPKQYIARCAKSVKADVAKRKRWEARAAKARQLLDDLGGAAKFKDAKLDWDNDDL